MYERRFFREHSTEDTSSAIEIATAEEGSSVECSQKNFFRRCNFNCGRSVFHGMLVEELPHLLQIRHLPKINNDTHKRYKICTLVDKYHTKAELSNFTTHQTLSKLQILHNTSTKKQRN